MTRALVWEGDPWRVAESRRHEPVIVTRTKDGQQVTRAGLERRSDHAEAEVDMAQAFARQWEEGEAIEGPVMLQVALWCPKRRRQGPADGLAYGAKSWPLHVVLDALQTAGVMNESQVVACLCVKRHDPKRPRVVVRAVPWVDDT